MKEPHNNIFVYLLNDIKDAPKDRKSILISFVGDDGVMIPAFYDNEFGCWNVGGEFFADESIEGWVSLPIYKKKQTK